MKTRKFLLPMVGLSMLLGIGFIEPSNTATQVDASFKDVVEVKEDFNKKELNSDTWATNDVKLNVDHYSLRMSPTDYLWTGHLVQQNDNCYMRSNYCLEMDITSYSTVGNWFAISLGLKEKSGRFSDAPFALLYYPNYVVAGVNGNVCDWEKNGYLAPIQENIYATPFMKYGVYYRLKINVILVNSYTSLVYYDIYDLNNNIVKEHDPVNDVYLVNDTLSGYIGINNSGLPVEITRFKITNTETGSIVYDDDFTKSSIQYVSEGSGDWASLSFSTSEVFLGPVADLGFNSKDSYITAKKSFTSSGNNSIYTLYREEMTFSYLSMTTNAVAGFEISKPSLTEPGYLYGLKKNDNGFGYSLLVLDKENKVLQTVVCSTDAPNSTLVLSIEVHNDRSVTLSTSDISVSEKVDKVNGYFGVKNISLNGTAATGPIIDDFSMTKTVDMGEQAPDVAINFDGVKQKRVGPLLLNDFYIPKREWQYTNGKSFKLSDYDDEYVGTEPQNGKAVFDNANTTYFGSKNKYTNYVAKFDIQVTSDVQFLDNYAAFVFEFGLEKFATYYDNAQSVGIYNIIPADKPTTTQSILLAKHSHFQGSDLDVMNFPIPGQPDQYYQLFDKRGGEYPTFNFVIVVKDGLVSVAFKFSDEPESVLLTPRVTLVADKSTFGYCAIMGINNLSFTLDNYSITNLDYMETDSEYVAYKDSEYQLTTRKDFSKEGTNLSGLEVTDASISNKALKIKDGGEVKTSGKLANGFFRYRIKSIEESVSFNIGNASISLVDDNISKKVIVKDAATNQTIPLASDFVFSNCLIEFEKVGGLFEIKLLSGDKPLSAISLSSYNFTLSVGELFNYLVVKSSGLTSISLITIVNYDSHQTIKARDYNPSIDDVVAWTERTSLQEKGGCSGSITTCSILLPLIALSFIALLLVRRRKEAK